MRMSVREYNAYFHGVPEWHAGGYVDFPNWQRTLEKEPTSERAQRVREWWAAVNASPLGYKSAEAAKLAMAEHRRLGLDCCAE